MLRTFKSPRESQSNLKGLGCILIFMRRGRLTAGNYCLSTNTALKESGLFVWKLVSPHKMFRGSNLFSPGQKSFNVTWHQMNPQKSDLTQKNPKQLKATFIIRVSPSVSVEALSHGNMGPSSSATLSYPTKPPYTAVTTWPAPQYWPTATETTVGKAPAWLQRAGGKAVSGLDVFDLFLTLPYVVMYYSQFSSLWSETYKLMTAKESNEHNLCKKQ